MNPALKAWLKTYWPYLAVTAVVMLPLLLPGYILTLDAVFTPHISAPHGVSSDFLWQWLLHLLNVVVPSQLIEKAIFIGILLGSGIGMHRLLGWLRNQFGSQKTLAWTAAIYIGGFFFMVNSFTYDRFMAGQYGVLLGYALLPYSARALLTFAEKPGRVRAVHVALLAVLTGILSLPTVGEFAVLAFCILAGAAWQARRRPGMLWAYARYVGLAVVAFGVLSSYWLAPALLGQGTIARQVATFTPEHTAAFATAGDTALGRLAHVLRLQGFWAETHRLFVMPQDHLSGWGTVRLVLWALVTVGVVTSWRRARALAATFATLGVLSTVAATGLLGTVLTRIGYREPQKFVGLLALAMAVFLAVGAARCLAWARQRSVTRHAVVAVALALVVCLFTPTMLFGFAGQLRPRHYPADWATANSYLNQQPGKFAVVFLPWHQYMSFGFAGRIIANPAPRYFDRPVYASNDPELGAIKPLPGTAATIGTLVHPGRQTPLLAVQLARYNVRYIVLANDYDFQSYRYLDTQPGLRRVRSTPSLRIYEVLAWKGEV